MFDGIRFTHSGIPGFLSSKQISHEFMQDNKMDPENIYNSEFSIGGSTDGFLRPPITDFAREHLFYMQAFNIFYYIKGSFTRRKNYNSYLVLYTYNGTASLEYNGKKYTLNEGDGAFIDCHKAHFYSAITKWDVAVLHLNGPLASFISSEYEKKGSVVFHEPLSGGFQKKLEEILDVYSSSSLQRDLLASYSLESLLLHLLMPRPDDTTTRNDIPLSVQTSMRYIEENYTKYICLDDLAALTATSKYHLAKEFKRYTGFTPHDYLIRIRINQARILLKTTTIPVCKISHMVGIHDINNFNYLFKKRMGKTPGEYRSFPDFMP